MKVESFDAEDAEAFVSAATRHCEERQRRRNPEALASNVHHEIATSR